MTRAVAMALRSKGLAVNQHQDMPPVARVLKFRQRREKDRIIVAELDDLRAVIDTEQTSFGLQWHWSVERGDELVAWGKGMGQFNAQQRALNRFNEEIKPQNIKIVA